MTFIPFYLKYSKAQLKRYIDKKATFRGKKPKTQIQATMDYLPLYSRLFEEINNKQVIDPEYLVDSKVIDEDKWIDYRTDFIRQEGKTQNDFDYYFKLWTINLFLSYCDHSQLRN